VRRGYAVRWILSAVFLAALAGGCGGGGDESPGAMTGEVITVDASTRSIELRGDAGERGVYLVDESTKLMSGSEVIEFQELANGTRVVVDAHLKKGRMVATYVEVVDE